jgi:tRNA nucleotidyltransferase (CCA-adding enzyme)
MDSKIKEVLSSVQERVSPAREELIRIKKSYYLIKRGIEEKAKILRIKVKVFAGGSFAKGTLIKKNNYDLDIFVRFDKEHLKENISELLKKIVPSNAERVHGSRDYFLIKEKNLNVELIPVLDIKNPENASNTTDLSYFHVRYILKKIKKKHSLKNEIQLAKTFVYSSGCYGAESYINGFSGYAIELLLVYYGCFIKFVTAMAKINENDKTIIDLENSFKKMNILKHINESKITGPLILIDPTFNNRNATSSLSKETLIKFKMICGEFLRKPSNNFFRDIDEKNKERFYNMQNKDNVKIIEIRTSKQKGDIAGTALKKFFEFFCMEAKRYFYIKFKDFEYDESKNLGRIYILIKEKDEILYKGPLLSMKDYGYNFKRVHKKVFVKSGRYYAKEKNNIDIKKFIKYINSSNMGDKSITSIILTKKH